MAGAAGPRRSFVFHKPPGEARSAVEKEFSELPMQARAKLHQKMEKYSQGAANAGRDYKPLRDGIFEIRVQVGNNPYRVLFFLDGDVPVVVRCFHKKDQKVGKSEIDLAIRRRGSWVAGSGG